MKTGDFFVLQKLLLKFKEVIKKESIHKYIQTINAVNYLGDNIEEAKKNLQEAIELYLEDMPKERKYLSKEAPFVTAVDISRG